MLRDALIDRIRQYQHLIAGSECYVTFDGTTYQTVESGTVVTKTVGENNKPGAEAPDVSAWNNLGTVEEAQLPSSEKTALDYKKCTVGGKVKRKFQMIVEEKNTITFQLQSIPKEVLSIAFGVNITGIGSFTPFQQSTWNGWVKIQMVDESETLRLGMDLYCTLTLDGVVTVKGSDFATATLKCEILDAALNTVYNGGPNAE